MNTVFAPITNNPNLNLNLNLNPNPFALRWTEEIKIKKGVVP
jgi:hypothetical protein